MSYRFKELYSGGGIIEADALPNRDIDENAFYFVDGKYYKWVDGDWQEYVLASTGGEIIEVDALPTENIDENVFYLVGGRYYRWHKISTWVFKNNYLIPNEMLGKSYRCGFSVNTPSDGVQTMDKIDLGHGQVITFVRERDSYSIEVAELGYWYNKLYKSITITEMPTDEIFLEWLRDNATAEGVWHKYVPTSFEDDIIGTWVFEDVLSIPDEFYGNEYHFKYSVYNIPNIGDMEYTTFRFYDDGIKYIEYIGDDDWATVYQERVGWFSDSQAHKTIDIHEMPDDEAFITWLRMNATKYTGDIVRVKDDEPLPTGRNINKNKVYLKNDTYYKRNETNIWVFDDELSIPAGMSGNEYSIGYSVNTPNDGTQTFDSIGFSSDGTEVSFYRNSDGYFIDCVYGDGWTEETFKTITITEMPTDEVFVEWLRANATAEGSWEEYAETTSITPTASETWKFNDELTNIDKPFANGFEDVACSGYMLYDKVAEPFNFHFTDIRFYPDSVYLRNSDTNGIGIYYIDNFTYNFRHATITFTELPDDEVFLAWLKENATKISGGDSDAEESVVGTWVFKETIEIPSKNFEVEFTSDGSNYVLMEVGYESLHYSIEVGDYTDPAFDLVYGWQGQEYRKITITAEPTDTDFISWLKANATKQTTETTGAIAYTAKSVDELPNDAPDGSMALVESDSLVGKWEWKDNQSPLDLSMLNLPENSECGELGQSAFVVGYDDYNETIISFFYFRIMDDGLYIQINEYTTLYAISSFDDSFTTFELLNDVRVPEPIYFTLDDFKTFIKTNCNRLSGGYSLYIRQNGEWVYEREAEMSGGDSDADDSIVGTWVFNDELTMPDEMPSRFNCDFYVETQMDGTQRLDEFYILPTDEQMGYWSISYYRDDYNIEDVYESNYGWAAERYKTIKITKEPTDQAFISWLKANATKKTSASTGATAYTAKSVDELPSDAPDGSVAIVDSDSINGKWKLKNALTPINLHFVDGMAFVSVKGAFVKDEEHYAFNQFVIMGDDTNLEEIESSWNSTPSDYDTQMMGAGIYCGQLTDGFDGNIEIFEDANDTIFKQWLSQNADRISGGQSLYIRKNGEWVYKSEVS